MTDAIDKAVAAFDEAMGKDGGSSKSEAPAKPTERMFGAVGEHLDTSEERGGGDEDDYEEEQGPNEGEEDEELEDDDGSDDEESDDDDADDEPDGDDAKYTVTVDGEQEEVSLKEALNGYIRTKTFHKRMNHLNEVQQAVRSEGEKVIQDRQKYITMIGDLEEQIGGILPKEPDWEKAFAEDPIKARALQVQFEEVHKKLASLKEAKQKVMQEQAEEERRHLGTYAKTEFDKFVAINKYTKEEDLKKDLSSMRRTGLAHGFSEQELSNVYDSRMLMVLLKASKYDRMMANRPKAARRGTKSVPPGAGSNGTAHKGVSRAQRQLSRSGHVDDAARVFEKLIR